MALKPCIVGAIVKKIALNLDVYRHKIVSADILVIHLLDVTEIVLTVIVRTKKSAE